MTKKTQTPAKSTKAFDYKTIKSYEDACKKLNIDPDQIPFVSMISKEMQKAIIAVYQLFIIFKAINDGWEPNWNDYNEYKYFPWLEIKASSALSSGFGFDSSLYNFTLSGTSVGSRLCTDTSEKAIYIGKTFQDEYKEFFLIQK
jgi:hypothetical protein